MPIGSFQTWRVRDQAAATVSRGNKERLSQYLAQFVGVGQVVNRAAHARGSGRIRDQDRAALSSVKIVPLRVRSLIDA